MQYSELRTRLVALHMDSSTQYAATSDATKECVNDAYEYVYDLLKNTAKIKRQIATAKVAVTITNKTSALPVDFDVIDIVSTENFTNDSDIELSDNRYYDFQVVGQSGAKTLQISDTGITTLYIRYVPVRTPLSGDTDEPTLPTELQRSIVDFGLVEYYRRIRDNVEAANALNLAQSILSEKLSRLG